MRMILSVLVGTMLGIAGLSAQDSKDVTAFKDAVEKKQASSVQSLAQTIAGANTKKAVDVLVDGYDILAQVLNRLWQQKLAWQGEIDKYDDWMDEVKRFNKEIEERNKKGTPADPGIIKKRDDLLAKINKFNDTKEQIVKIENEIVEINRIKRHITDALATIKDDAAVKEMIHEVSRNGNWSARAAVAEAMGKIEHPDVIPTLVERCAKEQDAMVLCAILEAFKAKNQWTTEVINAAGALLKSKYWQVQLTAAQVLGGCGNKDAVEPLMNALAGAEGRPKWEIHDALVRLTGVDKGLAADAWKTWYDTNKEAVKGGTYKPKEGEAAGPVGVGEGSAPKGTVTFYGIPVKSKAFIIIMDRSGSMAEPGGYDEEEERTVETGGASVKDSKIPDLKPDPRMRKIDIAKYQVKKVLYRIDKGVKFNVIFFNHMYTVYKPDGMVVMDEGARKSAVAWVEALEPEGNTDPWQAIQKAMEFCAEPGFDGKPRKDGADTIYIMSDGTPFPPGKVVGTNEICEKVKEWNRLRKIVFNTVYVSAPTDKDYANGTAFMKRLAEENGGICKIPKNGGGAQPGGAPNPNDPNKKP